MRREEQLEAAAGDWRALLLAVGAPPPEWIIRSEPLYGRVAGWVRTAIQRRTGATGALAAAAAADTAAAGAATSNDGAA